MEISKRERGRKEGKKKGRDGGREGGREGGRDLELDSGEDGDGLGGHVDEEDHQERVDRHVEPHHLCTHTHTHYTHTHTHFGALVLFIKPTSSPPIPQTSKLS